MCGSQERGDMSTETKTSKASLDLMYYGVAPLSVRGPVTGKLYRFSRLDPVQSVDARDAAPILKTRLFRRLR
jgi:hypothetical protein